MSTSARLRRSRIAHFKAVFLLSIAPAALNLACGGKTDSGTTDEAQTDEAQTGAEQTGEVQTDEAQTGAEQTDEVQTDARLERPGAEDRGDSQVGFFAPPLAPGPYFSPLCPEVPETPGASCSQYIRGLTCEYDSVSPLSLLPDTCNGTSLIMHCSESMGLWEELPVPTCSPPPPSCEATLPIAGSDCSEPGVDCPYRSECSYGRGIDTATCLGGQWLIVLYGNASCDPQRIVPVCPERESSTGEVCAYPGQECSRATCDPRVRSRAGHLCSAAGVWQDSALLCLLP